jgi:glycosyltransferase involved in cell wall biosynthesis
VAIVGSLTERKSVDRFVSAASIVGRTIPDAQFLVVGDGPLRAQLEALAVSSGCADAVRFLGVRRDATAIVQRATAVVSTSHAEGLSLVALETLGAGTPLIAPDVGGMRRLLQSRTGVLLDDTEPTTVAAAIVAVLGASDDERTAMGDRGRALVESQYSQRHMLEEYMVMYGELSRGARSSRSSP